MTIDINFLKTLVDKKPVKIIFLDGEEIVAKIVSVSETEKDLVYKMLSTNHQYKYTDTNRFYLAQLDQVKSVI